MWEALRGCLDGRGRYFLSFSPPSFMAPAAASSWASAPPTFLGRSPCLHLCYSSSLAGVPLQALVSLTRWKLLEPSTLTENVLGLQLCFALSFWLPPVGVTQPKGPHFMQNYSTLRAFSTHFLPCSWALPLVHPGFVLF